MLGWRGTPEVRSDDLPAGGLQRAFPCPADPVNDSCLAALPEGWAVLTAAALTAVDRSGGSLWNLPVDLEPEPSKNWMGHVTGPALIHRASQHSDRQ
jgi:hypothetical protein